jgi:tetratricopeptide (TPR) repeat protein
VTGEIGQEPFQIACWKATAYFGLGQEQKGLELYVKALAAEKNPLLVWQMTKNSILKAIDPKTLASSMAQQTDSVGAKVALACSYFAADDYTQGDKIYRELFNTAKDNQEKVIYLYVLGQEYTEKHKYSEAAAVFEETRKLDPDNLAVLNNLAYILEEYQGKAADALSLMTPKFMAISTNPDLLDTYGQILVKNSKIEEGLYYTAKSVWIRDSSASRYHLGKILLEQNRRTEAGIQLKRALQLVGDDAVLEKAIRTELDKL